MADEVFLSQYTSTESIKDDTLNKILMFSSFSHKLAISIAQ